MREVAWSCRREGEVRGESGEDDKCWGVNLDCKAFFAHLNMWSRVFAPYLIVLPALVPAFA